MELNGIPGKGLSPKILEILSAGRKNYSIFTAKKL